MSALAGKSHLRAGLVLQRCVGDTIRRSSTVVSLLSCSSQTPRPTGPNEGRSSPPHPGPGLAQGGRFPVAVSNFRGHSTRSSIMDRDRNKSPRQSRLNRQNTDLVQATHCPVPLSWPEVMPAACLPHSVLPLLHEMFRGPAVKSPGPREPPAQSKALPAQTTSAKAG